ncbi:hypothetical protein IT408_01530 [Candidatus Uhrbacteria bacterium]|nr:hypothetical protein [Candidatus Uhrbacteria bacterium]
MLDRKRLKLSTIKTQHYSYTVNSGKQNLMKTLFESAKEFFIGLVSLGVLGIMEVVKMMAGIALLCGLSVIAWHISVTVWYWIRANYIG